MIEVQRVSKRFGTVRAVEDVSLSLGPGVVAGLLGPNGAGKTTLIRMMTGFLSPSAGRITVFGHDTVKDAQNARRAIGYLPESAPLYPEMSVAGYLRYRADLFGVPRPRRAAAIGAAAERCWLKDVLHKRIGHLSKGYRQRVGLAAAILHEPRALILDEPTSGLDPAQIQMMRGLVRDLAADRVVLLSSHILSEVELTCGRVVIVTGGRVRADGTPADLVNRLGAGATYDVEFAPTADLVAAERTLKGVPGVAWVQREGAGAGPAVSTRFIVSPAGAADVRENIARAAAAAGLVIVELSRRRPTLERIFMSILEERPAPPVAGGAAA